MSYRNLNAEEMVEVGTVFQDAVLHVLDTYEESARPSLQNFMVELILKERPYQLVTAEGIERAISMVWARDGIRDFILKLAFTFFSRWGHSDEEVSGLAANLARGVAMVKPAEPHNAVPKQLGDRLSDIGVAHSAIHANPWLMITLMIPLFVSIGSIGPLPKAGASR